MPIVGTFRHKYQLLIGLIAMTLSSCMAGLITSWLWKTVNFWLQNNSVTSYFLESPYHSEQLPPPLVKLHFVIEHGSPSNHRNVFSSDIDTILKMAVSWAVVLISLCLRKRHLINFHYSIWIPRPDELVVSSNHCIIQGVPGVKVTISEFNSRADSESKTSYTHGSNSQRFRSYEFLIF